MLGAARRRVLPARAGRAARLARRLLLPPGLVGYLHGVAVVLIIGQLGKLLGLDIDAREPLPQLVEVVREIGDTSAGDARRRRGRAGGPAAAALPRAARSRRAARRGRRDRRVGGARPRRARRRGRRADPVRAAVARAARPRRSPTSLDAGARRARALPRLLRRRGAHRPLVRRPPRPARPTPARSCWRWAPPTPPPASRRASRSGRAARAPRSTTRWARAASSPALLAAGAVVLVLLFLTGPIADLPKAVLGAVIVSAAIGLVDLGAWRELCETDRVELAIAAVTTARRGDRRRARGDRFAVGLSIVDVVRRSAQPARRRARLGRPARPLGRRRASTARRTSRPASSSTGSTTACSSPTRSYVKGRVREAVRGAPTETHALVLDAEAMTHIDTAGLDALDDLAASLARRRHRARAWRG